MKKVFVVDDETRVFELLKKALEGFEVVYFSNGRDLLQALKREQPCALFVDLYFEKTPSSKLLSRFRDREGLLIVDKVMRAYPDLNIILISRFADEDTLNFVRRRKINFVDAGVEDGELVKKLSGFILNREKHLEKIRLMLEKAGFYTRSREILQQVAALNLAPGNRERVLITGETGTGKNTLAKALHQIIFGEKAPFVELNLTTRPETLLESEIFGYERGAFTGAVSPKPGLLELAEGGTLVFDEISELAERRQARLLSVLEADSFRRIGGRKDIPLKAKIIGITPKFQLHVALKYRFDKVVKLPRLDERREDVELIIELYERRGLSLTRAAKNYLMNKDYPGNVRMLVNILRSMLASGEGTIDRAEALWRQWSQEPEKVFNNFEMFINWLEAEEKNLEDFKQELFEYLEKKGERPEKIMKLLGISRSTYFRMKRSRVEG